jgi:hypothetical protein
MKKIVVGLLVMIGLVAQAQQKSSLIHDDNVQKRNVASFNAIRVSNAIDLYLTQSNANEVAVSAKDVDSRNHIVTEVEGGTLIIRMEDKNSWFNWNNWGDVKAKAYVSVKELYTLQGSGATNIHVIGNINGKMLKIKLSGASDLKGNFDYKDLAMDLSGASNLKGSVHSSTLNLEGSGASKIELEGSTDDLALNLSGASNVKMHNLISKGAIVETSGASDADINVSELLKVTASGASNVNYKGAAVIKELRNTGASNVRHRN